MNVKHLFILSLIWFSTINTINAQETEAKDSIATRIKNPFPTSLGWVSDFEHILTPEEEQELCNTLRKFERKTSNEICIVTIASISPYDNFADYATDLGNAWGIGKKQKDNGLLIVLSKHSHQVRIATGLGTEKILTDAMCQEVVQQIMIPEFKKGSYFNGIQKGVDRLIKQWK